MMCHRDHGAPSFYAWLGFAFITLIGRGMNGHQHPTVLKNDSEGDKKQPQSSPVASKSTMHNETKRHFPWEPKTHGIQDAKKNENEPSLGSTTRNSHHTQGQSEFLSMMTFANQSLRQPSCPCCR
jgi:hypothetical protein